MAISVARADGDLQHAEEEEEEGPAHDAVTHLVEMFVLEAKEATLLPFMHGPLSSDVPEPSPFTPPILPDANPRIPDQKGKGK